MFFYTEKIQLLAKCNKPLPFNNIKDKTNLACEVHYMNCELFKSKDV